jgi:hypothetical protein
MFHRHARWKFISSAVFLMFMMSGCGRRPPASPVVARVGDEALTLDEAVLHIDTTRGNRSGQLHQYVALWINTELLYQEAKRKGVDNTDGVLQQVADARRQIATEAYLEQYVYNDTASVSEDTLHAYYALHSGEFYIPEDVRRLNIAVMDSREKASAFAAAISQGTPWARGLAALVKDTTAAPHILSTVDSQYYTVHTIVPPELWKVTQPLVPGEVSFPVKTGLGYAVVQLVNVYKQGTLSPYDLAKSEVRQRVQLEQRRRKYESVLHALRNRTSVQVYFTSPTDSVTRYE